MNEQQERFVPARPVSTIISDTVSSTVEGAWNTVQTPFEDLNIKRQPIPEALQQIADNPYALPAPLRCKDIDDEIAGLDTLLGPDVCTPGDPTGTAVSHKGEYVEKGAALAQNQVVGIVSNKVNIIPFRGVVRQVTGAERHAREVERAYQAGRLRRAFLKGISVSKCPKSKPG